MHNRLFIYCVIDILANQLEFIFTQHNDASAMRFFGDVVNKPGHAANKHPADFELRCLGEIDTQHQVTPESRVVLNGATARDMNDGPVG